MKKLLLSAISLLIYLTGHTQAVNHPQSFDAYGWGVKDSNNIILSIGHWDESYIVNYDLTNGDFTYLNDSNSLRLGNFVMIGDTGIAETGAEGLRYTYDNWKTISQSDITNSFDKCIKTKSGFLARRKVLNNYYHSADLNTWTLVDNNYAGPIVEKDGKVWMMKAANSFSVSYDGGLTFIYKSPAGNPSTSFREFVPFDTLSGIGIVSDYIWHYTIDGGNNWVAFPSTPSLSSYIYASGLDSIYADFTSTGIHLSLDTGATWQPVNIPLPNNTASRLYPVGNYLVSQTTATYTSPGIGLPWSQLHKRLGGGTDVSFYKDKGIIVTGNGDYYYSNDKGKTYYMGPDVFGNNILEVCEFVNDSIILVSDDQSNIWKSNDGGTTWNQTYHNPSNWGAHKFRVSEDLSVMVLFKEGQCLFSKTQGDTWNFQGSIGGSFDGTVTPSGKILIFLGDKIVELGKSSSGYIYDVLTFTEPNIQGVVLEMVDENNGYALAINTTDSTTVTFRTTDGWASYTKTGTINSILTNIQNPDAPSFTFPIKLALNIIGLDTLCINRIGDNVIYKSFNGGVSWNTETIVPYKQGTSTTGLLNMHYFNAETFISVWGDRIVQNTTGNIVITDVPASEKVLDQQLINVFPNPTIDVINLQAEVFIQDVYIVDINGKLIVSEHLKSKTHQIDLGDLPAGIYFLNIKTDKAVETKKIVKQN